MELKNRMIVQEFNRTLVKSALIFLLCLSLKDSQEGLKINLELWNEE